MDGVEAIRQAMRQLRAHKLRAVLTLFGLVWGTAAVIFLVGWGEGVNAMLERGFFKTGKNLGQIWAGRIGEDFTPAVDRRFLWFTLEDVERLRRRSRLPELIGAEIGDFMAATYRQRAINTDVRGVDPEVLEIRGVPIAAGRGIARSDLDHRRRVALLGEKTRRRLLGPEGGVGSRIRLAGTPFRVIGVLKEMGAQLNRDGNEIDEQIWVPLTTFHAHWPRWWTDDFYVRTILYRMRDRHLFDETEQEMRAILAERLGSAPDDDEAIVGWSPVKILRQLPMDQTKGLMLILATATLVIGGVGTLNMMLDAVHERRREIGVRMAVGARRIDVVGQFFLETFVVVAVGGVLGVALGVGGCLVLSSFHVPDLIPIPELSLWVVALAIGVMSAVGLAAGVVPAWRASRVDPAVTLRMD